MSSVEITPIIYCRGDFKINHVIDVLQGDIVLYDGFLFQARWRTQGDRPEVNNAQNPWILIEDDVLP